MSLHLLIVASIYCSSWSVFPTIQERDLVILDGQRLYASGLPSLGDVFPSSEIPEFQMVWTSNRKGYTATWATFQNKLYLIGLEARVAGKKELQRNSEIVPGHDFPVRVTEWSGAIIKEDESWSVDADTEARVLTTETTTITVKQGLVTGKNIVIQRGPKSTNGKKRPKYFP